MPAAQNSALAVLLPLERASVDGSAVNTVDARRLHAWLGVGRDFSNWIKGRIDGYGFVEGSDFITESRSPNPASGNRGASIEYHLTLGMARELAMVENNDRGREARRYFIDCEKLVRGGASGQLTGLGPDPARTIGGIVRGVVAKQMANAETRTVTCLTEVIHAEVAALEARLMEAMRRSPCADAEQMPAPAASAPATYVTAFDVVALVAPSTTRERSLAQIASAGLRKRSAACGEPVRRHPSGRHQFAAAIAREWLMAGGLARLQEATR